MRPFWDLLPEHVQHLVLDEYRPVELAPGTRLPVQARLAEYVMIVRSGFVLETRTTAGEQSAVLGLLGPGDCAGLQGLAGSAQRAHLVCAGRVELLRLPQARFRHLAEQHREVADAVLKTLNLWNIHDGLRLALALSPDAGVEQKVAAHLVDLADQFGLRCGGAALPPGVSQQDFGRYAGVTRARVNQVLQRFTADGLIAQTRKRSRDHQITDLHGLRRLAEPYDDMWHRDGAPVATAPDPVRLPPGQVPLPAGLRWPRPPRLPADLPHFAGRQAELDRLRELLLRTPGPRIVVVDGPPGSGKSALAARFAHRFASSFPDSQIMVDVRSRDVPTVIGSILRRLGLPGELIPHSQEELTALYRRIVAGRGQLLILDNATTPEVVRMLLPRSESCAVIVTTQRAMPELGAGQLTLGPLTEADSQELVGSIAPEAEDTGRKELTRLCDRHPLGLSVAAAALARNTAALTEIVTDHEPPGIRAAFTLAYRTLPDDQRRLFRLLGLAVGPDFSAEACAALAGSPVEGLLAELERACLITGSGPGRYRMHPLLQDFALDRVRLENTEAQRVGAVSQMIGHYLAEAQRYGDDLGRQRVALHHTGGIPAPVPAGRAAALDWFEREHRCLVRAVHGAAAIGRPDLAYLLADACHDFLELRRYARSNIDMHRVALTSARIAGDRRATAHMLRHLAMIQHELGDNIQAVAYCWMAREIFESLDDVRGMAFVHENLAAIHQVLDQHDEALRCAERARELRRACGDICGEATARLALAAGLTVRGRYEEALREAEQALTIRRRHGDRRGEAQALRVRSEVLYEWEKWEPAHRDAIRGLALCREIKDSAGEAWAHIGLAKICRVMRRHHDGLEHGRRAVDLCRAIGDLHAVGWARIWLGRLLAETADLDGAIEQLTAALRLHTEIDHPSGQAAARTCVAGVHLRRGRLHDARTCLEQALMLARRIGDRRWEARSLAGLATTLRRMHQLGDAQSFGEAALAAWQDLGHRRGTASVFGGLARVHLRAGRFDEALAAAARATAIRTDLGDTAGLGRMADTRALIHHAAGRHAEALADIDDAIPRLRTAGARFWLADACRVRAQILLALGRDAEAADQAAEALDRARELGARHTEAAALSLLGMIEQRSGRDKEALHRLGAADAILAGVDDQRSRIPVLEAQYVSLHRTGDHAGADYARRLRDELATWLDPG
jgi:CRP-like cAMP-binding protein/tetratricopeptide (TPR) repeat protein